MIQGIASNWAALAVNVAVSFFMAPFVVGKLGAQMYGVWAVTMQMTGYLYLLDFGVRESVVRYTSKYTARKQAGRLNRIITVALWVYGAVAALTLAVTGVFVWLAPDLFTYDPAFHAQARWTILIIGLTIAQTFVFNVFTGVMLGLQRWAVSNLINIGVALARAALIVTFLNLGYGIVALALIQFLAAIASGTVVWWLATGYLRQAGAAANIVRMPWRRFRALAWRVFGYGFFVFLSNVGQKIIVASDAIIIAVFLPLSSVTSYAIAGTLITSLQSLLGSTSFVFAPEASRLDAIGDRQRLGDVIVSGSKFVLVLALPVAITYMILGSTFISLWMGPEFSKSSGEVLTVLAGAVIVSAPSYVIGMVLYGISRHNIAAYLIMGEAAANLILSVVLVQRMGILGVALGTAIPRAIVAFIVLPVATCRAVGYPFTKFLKGTYQGPLMAAIPLVLTEIWVSRNVSFGGLTSFFGMVALLSTGYLLLIYWWALDRLERAWLLKLVGLRTP